MLIGYVLYYYTLFVYKGEVYTYSAWASGVARSTGRALLEP